MTFALAAALTASAGWSAAHAQSASGSGAQEAETQAPAASSSATSATTPAAAKSRRGRPAANPAMQTGASPAPTGPNTSTVEPDTSDLSGSTGASITQSQGSPPPGVTPPNGSAPDTGGGAAVDNVPAPEGGPHSH
jgi:hypothetical protein